MIFSELSLLLGALTDQGWKLITLQTLDSLQTASEGQNPIPSSTRRTCEKSPSESSQVAIINACVAATQRFGT